MMHYHIHPTVAVNKYLFPVTNLRLEYFVNFTMLYKNSMLGGEKTEKINLVVTVHKTR